MRIGMAPALDVEIPTETFRDRKFEAPSQDAQAVQSSLRMASPSHGDQENQAGLARKPEKFRGRRKSPPPKTSFGHGQASNWFQYTAVVGRYGTIVTLDPATLEQAALVGPSEQPQ